MSGTPAWGSGGRKPESLDDNDTFAYRKHGNQGSVWDMLQRDGCCRVLGGRPGPVLHIPFHTGQSEWKTESGVQVKGTWSLIRRVEIKQAERRPVKIQNSIIRYDRAVIYSYFRLNFLLLVHLRDMRNMFSLYLWDEPERNGTVLQLSPPYSSALISQKFYRKSRYIWKNPRK